MIVSSIGLVEYTAKDWNQGKAYGSIGCDGGLEYTAKDWNQGKRNICSDLASVYAVHVSR